MKVTVFPKIKTSKCCGRLTKVKLDMSHNTVTLQNEPYGIKDARRAEVVLDITDLETIVTMVCMQLFESIDANAVKKLQELVKRASERLDKQLSSPGHWVR